MHHPTYRFAACLVAGAMTIASHSCPAADLQPARITAALKRSADWQLAHPSGTEIRDWIIAPLYDGLLRTASATGDAKYLAAVIRLGSQSGWMPANRVYHADDHAVGHATMPFIDLSKSSFSPGQVRMLNLTPLPLIARMDNKPAKVAPMESFVRTPNQSNGLFPLQIAITTDDKPRMIYRTTSRSRKACVSSSSLSRTVRMPTRALQPAAWFTRTRASSPSEQTPYWRGGPASKSQAACRLHKHEFHQLDVLRGFWNDHRNSCCGPAADERKRPAVLQTGVLSAVIWLNGPACSSRLVNQPSAPVSNS